MFRCEPWSTLTAAVSRRPRRARRIASRARSSSAQRVCSSCATRSSRVLELVRRGAEPELLARADPSCRAPRRRRRRAARQLGLAAPVGERVAHRRRAPRRGRRRAAARVVGELSAASTLCAAQPTPARRSSRDGTVGASGRAGVRHRRGADDGGASAERGRAARPLRRCRPALALRRCGGGRARRCPRRRDGRRGRAATAGRRGGRRRRAAASRAAPTAHRRALVVAAARVLGLALLEHREQRRGDEDRGVRARPDADQQREREVLERVAAEHEERDDREERDERRRERARDRLPERDVGERRGTTPRFISGMFSRMRSKMMIVS